MPGVSFVAHVNVGSSSSFSQGGFAFPSALVVSPYGVVDRYGVGLSARVGRWAQPVLDASDDGRNARRTQLQRTAAVRNSKSGDAKHGRSKKAAQEQQGEQFNDWTTILEDDYGDDPELREVIADNFVDSADARKRVEERVRKKSRDMFAPKTGSADPMAVTFMPEFEPTDTFIWLELYQDPSAREVEIIGNVLTSWYLLGKLGSFNSMNMQLKELPVRARLTYSAEHAASAIPSQFVNVMDLEFQDNWGRFWVDLGTSDPVAMDVLINSLSAVSTDHVGIKRLVFGGENLGGWVEGADDPANGYKVYTI